MIRLQTATNITPPTTLLNVQFSFHGPSAYNSRILKQLCKKTQFQTELPTYPTIILRRPTSPNNAKFPSFFKIHQEGSFSLICHTQELRGNDVNNSVSISTKLYIYIYIPYYGLVTSDFTCLMCEYKRDTIYVEIVQSRWQAKCDNRMRSVDGVLVYFTSFYVIYPPFDSRVQFNDAMWVVTWMTYYILCHSSHLVQCP